MTRLRCRCEAGDKVCIDARCPSSLCFLTPSPPISNLHGFSNIFSAGLVDRCSYKSLSLFCFLCILLQVMFVWK